MRVGRFLAVGVINTVFGYASYAVCVLISMPLWIALVVSMIAALLFNFITYGGLVFKDLSRRNLPRFIIFYAAFAVINYSALRALEALGVKPILGQALLLPLLAVICYAGLRLFVFRAAASTAL
nr:GtrA family protein [Rhizobium lusitanum]